MGIYAIFFLSFFDASRGPPKPWKRRPSSTGRGALRSLEITQDHIDAGDEHDDDGGRGRDLAVAAPADGIPLFGGHRGAHHVGGGPDGGGAAADVGSHGQAPGQDREVHPGGSGQALDHRDHGGREGDVVHEGAGDGRDPHDDEDHEDAVAVADAADEGGDDFQDAGGLQSAHHHEETDQEEQGLIVHPPQQLPCVLPGGGQGQQGDEDAHEGHGQAGLGMGGQQDHCQDEDDAAAAKVLPVGDGGLGVRAGGGQELVLYVVGLELLAVAEVEEDQGGDEGDPGHGAGVGDEVPEGVAQRGADDDVGRIAAHGCRAAQIGAEDLCQDHGQGIEAQQAGQLNGHRRQEEDDGDAGDEHGQHSGDDHEGQKQRRGPVFHTGGQTQAHPADEAGLGHAFHHDHHPGDENDGGPVDPGGALGLRAGGVPEHWVEEVT